MLVKFLNSDSTVSTAIAGSYFKGDGWTGAYYDSGTGKIVFESEDGLGFTTEDLRVGTGGTSTVEWTTVLNKPTSFPPSAHTHLWADITDKPTEFTPVSHNHTISSISGLQAELDGKQSTTSFKTINNVAITGTGNINVPVSGYRVLAVPGNYVTQIDPALAISNSAMIANRLRLAAFSFDRDITIDLAGLRVTTASTGSARIYIYERTEYDRIVLVAQTGDLDTGSTGYVSEALNFTFEAGKVYLSGAVFSGTPTVASVGANQSILSLGMTNPTQATQIGTFQIALTFGTAPPANTTLLDKAATAISAATIMRMA